MGALQSWAIKKMVWACLGLNKLVAGWGARARRLTFLQYLQYVGDCCLSATFLPVR